MRFREPSGESAFAGVPDLPPEPAPYRGFPYLRFAKTEMAGARFQLCMSGVPAAAAPAPDLSGPPARSDLGEALARWRAGIGARYGVPEDHVHPAFGTSGAVLLALGALVAHEAPRPAIAIEEPAYGVFAAVAGLLGCETRGIARSEGAGWAVDLDAADAAFARGAAVFCCSDLHNPTGARLSAADLASLDEIAARHGAWVLVDEVYRDFLPGPVATSYRPGSRVVAVGSLTKCHGFGLQRAGWVFAPPEVLDRAESVGEALLGEPPTDWARGIAALVPHAEAALARGRALAETARPVMDAWIATTPHVSWTPPAAGITGLVRIDGLRDSMTFARRLRAELDCQVVPGAFFGAEGTIRVSFGLPPRDLQAALDVLALRTGDAPNF